MYFFKIYMQLSVNGSVVCLLLLVVQLPIVYSSLQDLFQMIENESKLIGTLQKFLEIENKRLKKLEVYTDTLLEHAKMYTNEDEFAWNPLAIYKAIKHLTVDLEDGKMDMMREAFDGVLENRGEKSTIVHNENIFHDSISNLTHLQQVYNVSVTDMVEGRLASNLTIKTNLTPEDCFLIGETCYKKYNLKTAVDWLQGCHDKFHNVTRAQASEMILSSALILDDKFLSREALILCIKEIPRNRLLYTMSLIILSRKFSVLQDSTSLNNKWKLDLSMGDEWKGFRACGKNYYDQLVYRNLKCQYVHHGSPFLMIAPLKEEVLSFVPRVSLFRDAVYESEMEQLKTDAFDKFHVVQFRYKDELIANRAVRPAQGAPLINTDHLPLRNRLEDLSFISLKDDERFQMIKYGPGGFFRMHRDFRTPEDVYLKILGNRLATAILYLNDVALGGYTAFPYLRLRISPAKGSILFWMNVKPNGYEEPLVKHVACPVIYGEKIICSQFFKNVNFCPEEGKS